MKEVIQKRYKGNTMEIVQKYLTPREAAKYCGVSPKTLESWRRLEKGPSYSKISSKLIRYDVSDLDSWMDSHRNELDNDLY